MKIMKTVSTFSKADYGKYQPRTYLLQFRYLSSKRTIQARFPKKPEEGNINIEWGEWRNWLEAKNQKDLLKAISEGRWTKDTARVFLSRLAKEVRKNYKSNFGSPFRKTAITI